MRAAEGGQGIVVAVGGALRATKTHPGLQIRRIGREKTLNDRARALEVGRFTQSRRQFQPRATQTGVSLRCCKKKSAPPVMLAAIAGQQSEPEQGMSVPGIVDKEGLV